MRLRFWLIALCGLLLLPTRSGVAMAPEPGVVLCNGDDGLTSRLCETLRLALRDRSDLGEGLTVRVPNNVRWKRVTGRTKVFSSIELGWTDGRSTSLQLSHCFEDRLPACGRQVMNAAQRVAGKSARRQIGPYALADFDEEGGGSCRAKGRLQDWQYCKSKTMVQILEDGKAAIPMLIAQLTDTRPAESIYDYWTTMTVGDVAHFILSNLFLNADEKTSTMVGMGRMPGDCSETAEACWVQFLKVHGRKYVQNQWAAAWTANQDRVYWDMKNRCYRLRPKPGSSVGKPSP